MSSAASTATRWFQAKRIPLYLVVGGTWGAAIAFFRSRSTHPHAELDKAARQDPLKETEGANVANTSAYGAQNQASPMRHRLRSSGAMEGQATDGIFPNEAISKKLGDIMGPNHPPKDGSK